MTKPKEKWQKEFDKRFVGIKSHFSDWLIPENGEIIKQFIQKVRDEAYEEGYEARWRDEIKKLRSFIDSKLK